MRHAVFFLCYNTTEAQLELSKLALDSVLAQDIGPLDITVIDNGSDQQTKDWLRAERDRYLDESFILVEYETNTSPLKVANGFLRDIFDSEGLDCVLGIPNDVILPPNAYREMASWPRGFVCATPHENVPLSAAHSIFREGEVHAVSECTPMCCMLTRRWAYDAIVAKDGYFFDEKFEHYASDCDLALRMAACGIRGVQLDLPVWHYRSASWRLAAPGIGKSITDKADADQAYFKSKYGFAVDSPQYGASAADINFKG